MEKFCYVRSYRQKKKISLEVTDHLYRGVVFHYGMSDQLWGVQEKKN